MRDEITSTFAVSQDLFKHVLRSKTSLVAVVFAAKALAYDVEAILGGLRRRHGLHGKRIEDLVRSRRRDANSTTE